MMQPAIMDGHEMVLRASRKMSSPSAGDSALHSDIRTASQYLRSCLLLVLARSSHTLRPLLLRALQPGCTLEQPVRCVVREHCGSENYSAKSPTSNGMQSFAVHENRRATWPEVACYPLRAGQAAAESSFAFETCLVAFSGVLETEAGLSLMRRRHVLGVGGKSSRDLDGSAKCGLYSVTVRRTASQLNVTVLSGM